MKHDLPLTEVLTAKQRLAVSRQALVLKLDEPLWAGMLRGWIRRRVAKLELSKAEPKQALVTSQSDQAAIGRTLS